MIPVSGDKDYPQSPFTAVFTPTEIVREYGDGCMFASGLIVDGMRAFNNNLWAACDCAMNIGEIIKTDALREKIKVDCASNGAKWKEEGLSPESPDKLLQAWLEHNVENYADKVDWIRRAKQFADRYFDHDMRKMTYCLKDVTNWKLWCDLTREYKDVDWTECIEDEAGIVYDMGAGAACSSGQCDLGELGLVISEKTQQKEIA
jgi:ribonucleoside-diphosphate reductase alpha chain